MKRSVFYLTACLIHFVCTLVSGQGLNYPVAGTGVTLCYGNNVPIICPTDPADSFYGQFHGTQPAFTDNGDGTVTDLITGLMWVQGRGTKISWDSTFIMASQCTAGGHSDWRVPTIKELYSLINFNGRSGPDAASCIAYLDTNYFEMAYGNTALGERVIDAQDWSATRYTALTMMADSTIFGVNFVDGRIKGYPKYQPPLAVTPQRMYVRFVRGNTAYGLNNFTDNGDSTITDHATGLMWSRYDAGSGMDWQSALAYVQLKNTQHYLGYNDWRMPHAKELQSIVDYSRSPDATGSAAIDPLFNCSSIIDEAGNPTYPFYWSSTTHLDNMGAVYVAFGEAPGWMKMPPNASYYTLKDVHGAGAQRSDPKTGSPHSYYLGVDQSGDSVFGLGPQGDVIRINNFLRLVRDISGGSGINEMNQKRPMDVFPDPATSEFCIILNSDSPAATIFIYDLMGKKVRSILPGSENIIRASTYDLAEGFYFIVATTSAGQRFSEKILILK